jgi:hypothetical protein
MLIEEWRPKLYCKDIPVDNISPNGRVFFKDITDLGEEHKYFHEDDIVDGEIRPFNESSFMFQSPTGIIKDMYEQFDTIPQAKKYVKRHKLPITWEQLVYGWEMLGEIASASGTLLHAYGESLWNKWDMPRPVNEAKLKHLEALTVHLQKNYVLSKTELLVYSLKFRLAGQVDLLVKNAEGTEYTILDYKFLSEPLDMKSFYNRFTRKYKMMYGPFNRLMDCNHIHYSIQMEIYRYLMGKLGTKVVGKKLMVITNEGYQLVDGYPMRIWIDEDGILQARYRYWKGRLYDSSQDIDYMENPYRII